jgi:hypothetical protein
MPLMLFDGGATSLPAFVSFGGREVVFSPTARNTLIVRGTLGSSPPQERPRRHLDCFLEHENLKVKVAHTIIT